MAEQDAVLEFERAAAERVVAAVVEQLTSDGYANAAKLARRAWDAALPALVRGRHLNPVHHTAHVLDLMVQILLGEQVGQEDLRIGIAAAVFHDAGNAFEPASERKLRKQDLDADPGLKPAAIAQRRRHMVNGGLLVDLFMAADLNKEQRAKVVGLVENHDNPTLAEFADSDAERRELLFVPQGNQLTGLYPLSAYLREADRLWMLTVPGVVSDLVRDLRNGKPWNPKGQVRKNRQRHIEEGNLCSITFPDLGLWRPSTDGFYVSSAGRSQFKALWAEAAGRPNDEWGRDVASAWLV